MIVAAVLLLLGAPVVFWSASARAQSTAGGAAVTGSPAAGTVPPAGTVSAPVPSGTPSTSPAAAPARVHTVVGLGDSVPAGTACDCVPYVDLVASGLSQAQGDRVTANNLAAPGQTSEGLLQALDDGGVRAGVENADLVLVTIGANDFDESLAADADCASATCYRDAMRGMEDRLARILGKVDALTSGHHTRVVVTGYWNVFLDGSVGRQQGGAYVANSDALTRAVNAAIESAATRAGAAYVDLYVPFKGDGDRDDTALLAGDGDHPSAQGHRVIAALVTAAVRSPAS